MIIKIPNSRLTPQPPRRSGVLAYTLAFIAAAVAMIQGGFWASLAVFLVAIFTGAVVEVFKHQHDR